MASISPLPNVGVGIRNTTLFCVTAAAKFGCGMLHPGASARPVMVKRAWTPPSRIVFVGGFVYLNRASRIGPSAVMNDGGTLDAPWFFATATCGLTRGADPPTAGCA